MIGWIVAGILYAIGAFGAASFVADMWTEKWNRRKTVITVLWPVVIIVASLVSGWEYLENTALKIGED